LAFNPITPRELSLVLDTARALLLRASAREPCAPLRGRQFGLMCESELDADAAFFRQAATALGAQVAHIRPSLIALHPPSEIQRTARMLGRLYDAVDCHGLLPSLVQQLALDAGVPVYDSLASAQHATARLVGQLGGEASDADKRRVILQAVLLGSVA
jgi:ornithine carbamoyltransferase